MSHKVLIAMVGLPRSGKTTWAQGQARGQGYPIVSPDCIRMALHGQRFVPEAEDFVWATAKVMVRALFRAGHNVVILDSTNTTRKRRDAWRCDEWKTAFVLINATRRECRERAEAEGDAYILPRIERMADQFEPLEPDELQW